MERREHYNSFIGKIFMVRGDGHDSPENYKVSELITVAPAMFLFFVAMPLYVAWLYVLSSCNPDASGFCQY